MVALQLLEGDALNVALLVPETQRTAQASLFRALTEHYGSSGRLADYRRQFEKTARHEGEGPSIIAIDLETLAVKAFGDMGPNVRHRLWLPYVLLLPTFVWTRQPAVWPRQALYCHCRHARGSVWSVSSPWQIVHSLHDTHPVSCHQCWGFASY